MVAWWRCGGTLRDAWAADKALRAEAAKLATLLGDDFGMNGKEKD